jgi:poly(A) polymerase
VLNRLYRAGHTAYLVGGSVRDLFLKRTPKDFDIVTSARPTQVRKLFRNCRLIGRRFRLAHVHFSGGEIVEVATFRCTPELDQDDLLLTSDNRFGSPEEDAYRRDFTINGLFYDIADYSVIDYVDGVRDIERRVVRTINDPWTRFQEDPVRMIRAIKFASKLHFKIESNTWAAMCELKAAIHKSPPPRVQEEFARLLEEGASSRALGLLEESGFLEELEPNLHHYLSRSEARSELDSDGGLLFDLLGQVDELVAESGKLTRALLFSVWLLPYLLAQDFLTASGPDLLVRTWADKVLAAFGASRKDLERVAQLLLAVRRFQQGSRKGRRAAPKALLGKSYFTEALAVYEMFLKATDGDLTQLDWWRDQRQNHLSEKKVQPAGASRSQGGDSENRSNRRRRFRKRK